MAKNNSINMTEGPILPKLLLFAIPLALASMLQLLFNAVDLVVVGKFAGDVCQAAVSSTGSLTNLITNLFIGLSVGSNVAVAKCIGSGDAKKVRDAVHTSICIAFFAGVVLTVIGVGGARWFLELMDSPRDVIDLSTTYLRIYFCGMCGVMTYNFGAAILRAKGDTKRPLYFLLISGIINAVLNVFFVVVFKMDVDGVAFATVISQYISAILVIYCLINEQSEIRLDLKSLYVDKQQLKNIAIIGLPAGIQGTVFSISNVTIQASINSFDSIVMAGNGAASNIEGFVYNGMNAFYQGSLTFTSQNIGAKRYDRINKILFVAIACVTVTGLILGGGSYIFGHQLVGIYTNDVAVIEAGVLRLSYVSKYYFICGIMDVLVGSLRGMGESFAPMIVSLLGACVFRLGWIATVFAAHRTLDVLFISYPISWIITGFAHGCMYMLVKRKFRNA